MDSKTATVINLIIPSCDLELFIQLFNSSLPIRNLLRKTYPEISIKLENYKRINLYQDLCYFVSRNLMIFIKFFVNEIVNQWSDEDQFETWNEMMCIASENGDKDLVKFFVKKNANDWDGGMASAARYGHMDLIHYFMKKGAQWWDKAMWHAAEGGYVEIVNFFISLGATDFNAGMWLAAKGGHKNLVEFFIQSGANMYKYGLYTAMQSGNIEIMKLMINKSMEYKRINGSNSIVSYGVVFDLNDALVNAVNFNIREIIKLLINLGANDWDRAIIAAEEAGHINLLNLFPRKRRKIM